MSSAERFEEICSSLRCQRDTISTETYEDLSNITRRSVVAAAGLSKSGSKLLAYIIKNVPFIYMEIPPYVH